jgi:integrase
MINIADTIAPVTLDWLLERGTPAAELPAAAPVVAAGPVPWETFKAELLEQYGPALRRPATRRTIEHMCEMLEALGVSYVHDLNLSLITRFVSTRDPKLSPNTVRSYLRVIQAICGHAWNLEYLPVSPFTRRPIRTWVRGSKPRGVRHLTKVQVRAMADVLASDSRDKRGWAQYRSRRTEALFTLIAWTGLRRGEAQWCQVQDLDLDKGIVWVVSRSTHKTKTEGSEKFVILPPPAAAILREWLLHRMDSPDGSARSSNYLFPNLKRPTPWTGGSRGCKPLQRLKAIARRAGVEVVSFQMLRRSCATNMEAAGASVAQIKRQLRHSSASTTEGWYMQSDLDNMSQAMQGFGY